MKKIQQFLIFLFSVILILQLIFVNPSMAITPDSSDIDPSSFSPGDGNGLNDTTTITVTYTASQDLYVNIFNQTSAIVAEDRAMTESPSGTYVYNWNGKNDTNNYVPDGTYTIRISDNPASNGDTIGTVQVNTTAPGSPSLSIDGGNTYATSVNVNLTISATGATKMKVSNYANFTDATWDNYATTKSWQLLSGDGTKTVYINFKTESGANASTSDTITLDTTLADPTLSINSGANSTNDRNVTLTISANGASYMKIDNDTAFTNMSSWITVATSYNFTLPAGVSTPTVYLSVKDDANNQKTTSDSIDVDTTPPTNLSISINNGESYTNSTSVNLALSANGGPVTMYLSNNASIWTEYSYTTTKAWTLSSVDGTKTVYFKAKDSAGNNASNVTSIITLDTLAPSQVTLSSPSSGETVTTQTPTFSWSNPNNISQTRTFYIEILQSGSVIESSYTNSSTTSYTSETLAEGVYTWRVTVYDMANNSATTSQSSFIISVEGLASPSPSYPTNGAYVNSSAPDMIRLRCSTVTGEPGGTIYYTFKHGLSSGNLNNTEPETSNPYTDISGYSNGQTVYWAVRARDTGGDQNTSNYSSVKSFTIDTQEPTLNSISINSGDSYVGSTSVTLTLSATDASWMMISNYANFSGASWEAYSATKSWTLISDDGVKTVYFKAKDSAVGDQGTSYPNINSSAINDNVTLDTAAPTISAVSPTSSTTTTTNLNVWASLSDSGSGVNTSTITMVIDSSSIINITTTSSDVFYVMLTASVGTHTVNVTATDYAGYTGYCNWSFTVSTSGETPPPGGTTPPPGTTVDNPPTIDNSSIYHQPTTVTSADEVTVYGKVTDDKSLIRVTVFWNDGTSHSKEMTLSSGTTYHANIGSFNEGVTVSYYIIALDNASQSSTSTTKSFTVADSNGPTITDFTPANNSIITDRTPTISATYSDTGGINISTVKLTINGVDVTSDSIVTSTSISYVSGTSMAYGKYTIKLELSDNSGNSVTIEWYFEIQTETIQVTKTIEAISEGETEEISFEEEGTSIQQIKISASKDIENLSITLTVQGTLPEGVASTPSNEVYMFIVIETNALEGDISSATIDFKVEKIWFTTNQIDENSVKLLRFNNGNWQELETSKVSEDDTYIYFESTTTGFSAFAIVGTKITEPVQGFNLFIIIGIVVAVVILIIIILFKTGYIYIEDKETKDSKTKKKEENNKKRQKK